MLLKLYLKDVKVLLSDKKGLMIFILMPMVLTTILSFALSGSFGEAGRMEPVKVAIVKNYDAVAEKAQFMETASQFISGEGAEPMTLDESFDMEKVFFETFLGNDAVKAILDPVVMTAEEATKALENDTLGVVVTLPEGFIYDQYVNFILPNRNPIDVQITQHPDYGYSGQIVESVFGSYFDTLNNRIISKNVYLEVGSTYLTSEKLFASMQDILSETENEPVENAIVLKNIPGKKVINSFTYYAISMMGMFILYSAGYMGRELLREKKMLTLDRGVVAGIHYGRVLAGKYLMTTTLCVLQMSALIGYAALILKVDWNEPVKILVGILFSSFAVSGVGVFISAITLTADNYRVANVFENLLIHVFALIGGSYIPLDVLPNLFQTLKYFALNGIVIDLFLDTYQNAAWDAMLPEYGMLLGIAIVFTGLAALIIRRKEVTEFEGTITS